MRAEYIADAQDENKTDALNVAKELNKPLVIECDVTQPERVEAMMKRIQDRHGGLDILVNNSGIINDRTIKKNVAGGFRKRRSRQSHRHIYRYSKSRRDPAQRRPDHQHVIVSGQMGLFGQANYSSSKAGIIAVTKVSAREFARQNITVKRSLRFHRRRNE